MYASTRQRLKSLLESPELTIAPGVYDGISARVVEEMGFKTAVITGAGVSNSRLGQPDFGILNLSENAAQSGMIADTVDIPVQADADTGYGNAVNVYHTVKTFEKAGVDCVMIEDQKFPKRCGHMAGKEVIPMEEMCGKVEAAVEARDETDPDLCIKARTDAAGPLGIDEAIRRLNAYADLGADIVFADAIQTKEEIEQLCSEVDAHVSVNMGFGIRERPTTPLVSPSDLEDAGAAMVSYPRLITASAIRGMYDALETLQVSADDGEIHERPDQVIAWSQFMELMDQPSLSELEMRFAPEDVTVSGHD
jgi:2-methylisocitrate lyase-like PEP mutase family enzyme